MSKRLILILALALVAGITCAAYAEVQNVKVSGDLTMQGVARNKLILRNTDRNEILVPSNEFDPDISGVLSQVRVRIDADLTDNVSTSVRLINERAWDEEAADSSDIDLDLAYVALKEFLYSPLSLVVGRQEIMFGNQLIIGDVDTNRTAAGHGTTIAATGAILPRSLDDLSLRKAFDAVKATLNYDPLVVDAVYAKIDENSIDQNDDVDLYGLNANYALDKVTTLEAYYWEKRRNKAGAASNQATDNVKNYNDQSTDDVVNTVGARAQYEGIKNLSLGLEGAFQFGTKVNNTTLYPNEQSNNGAKKERKAFAVQATGQYNLSDLVDKYSPSLGAGYTLLSGNKHNLTDNDFSGWDSMFENQAGGTIFNKIFDNTNLQIINASLSAKPIEDVKLTLDYYNLRFMKALNANRVYDINSVTLSNIVADPTYAIVSGKKSLGNEVDATLTYDYTEDVQFALSGGWFIAGDAFSKANNDDAKQVIGSMKVTF